MEMRIIRRLKGGEDGEEKKPYARAAVQDVSGKHFFRKGIYLYVFTYFSYLIIAESFGVERPRRSPFLPGAIPRGTAHPQMGGKGPESPLPMHMITN